MCLCLCVRVYVLMSVRACVRVSMRAYVRVKRVFVKVNLGDKMVPVCDVLVKRCNILV